MVRRRVHRDDSDLSAIGWFIGRDGQEYGPVSDDEMKTLAELGHLRPTDLVWKPGYAEWVAPASVSELRLRAPNQHWTSSPVPPISSSKLQDARNWDLSLYMPDTPAQLSNRATVVAPPPATPRAAPSGYPAAPPTSPRPRATRPNAPPRALGAEHAGWGVGDAQFTDPRRRLGAPSAARSSGLDNTESTASEPRRADVFVSYARADRGIAEGMVGELKKAGLEVWWDSDLVGEEFRNAIERELAAARVVVVIWSEAAKASSFVRDEASRAHRARKLVQARVDGFDPHNVPVGFGEDQISPVGDVALLLKAIARKGVVATAPATASAGHHVETIEDVLVEFARNQRFLATSGDLNAKLALWICYRNGIGLEYSWDAATCLEAEVAELHHPAAKLFIALDDEFPPTVKSRKALQELAIQGSADAKLMLDPAIAGYETVDDDANSHVRKAFISFLEGYAYQRSPVAMGMLVMRRLSWHEFDQKPDSQLNLGESAYTRDADKGLGPRNLAEIAFFAVEFFKGDVYWQAMGLHAVEGLLKPHDAWIEVHKLLVKEGVYTGALSREPSASTVRALLSLRNR